MLNNLYLSKVKLIYLGFAFSLLLIVPALFCGLAIRLTLFITLIPATCIGWLSRDSPDVFKIIIGTWLFTLFGFACLILAEVARFLYFLLVITFAVFQDLVFKTVHYYNEEEWFCILQPKKISNAVFYLIPMITLIVGSCLVFPHESYQNIKNMPVSINIIESILNGLFNAFKSGDPIQYLLDFANSTYEMGASNVKSLAENLLPVVGYSVLLLIPINLYKAFDPLEFLSF